MLSLSIILLSLINYTNDIMSILMDNLIIYS